MRASTDSCEEMASFMGRTGAGAGAAGRALSPLRSRLGSPGSRNILLNRKQNKKYLSMSHLRALCDELTATLEGVSPAAITAASSAASSVPGVDVAKVAKQELRLVEILRSIAELVSGRMLIRLKLVVVLLWSQVSFVLLQHCSTRHTSAQLASCSSVGASAWALSRRSALSTAAVGWTTRHTERSTGLKKCCSALSEHFETCRVRNISRTIYDRDSRTRHTRLQVTAGCACVMESLVW